MANFLFYFKKLKNVFHFFFKKKNKSSKDKNKSLRIPEQKELIFLDLFEEVGKISLCIQEKLPINSK